MLLLSSSSEQCRQQTTLLADGLKLNLNWSRFRVGFCFGYSFSLRFRLDISFSRKLLVRRMLGFCRWFSRWRNGRGAPLHVLFCGRENLNPTWKVVLAFVADVILETRTNTVLLAEDDFVRDLDHEVSSLTSDDINSAHHPLTEARH